jgi:exodeoxyribonuclease-3
MSLNLNGIRSAYSKGFVDMLIDKQPDIVCVQEVKAHEADIPTLPVDYFGNFHCAERKGYSGVGIVSKLEPDQLSSGISVKKYDTEGRVLRADFGDLSVLSVYVPSGSSGSPRQVYKMQFLKVFKTHVKKLLAEGRELIICGDINIAHQPIDLTNWQSNQKNSGFLPEERSWLDGFLALGLVDAYRHCVGPETIGYSWWSLRTNARARNVGWRLDYQFATPKLAEKISFANIPMEPNLSDHAPVIIDYDISFKSY